MIFQAHLGFRNETTEFSRECLPRTQYCTVLYMPILPIRRVSGPFLELLEKKKKKKKTVIVTVHGTKDFFMQKPVFEA